jgi:hypothetical protein
LYPNAVFGSFWFLNLLFDHDGGALDWITLMLSKLMILAPIVGIVFVFYAANSYGSEREVLLGTDWAILIKDDPNY